LIFVQHRRDEGARVLIIHVPKHGPIERRVAPSALFPFRRAFDFHVTLVIGVLQVDIHRTVVLLACFVVSRMGRMRLVEEGPRQAELMIDVHAGLV